MKALYESILDVESHNRQTEASMYLELYSKILDKRMSKPTKECIDMFGREIKIGDICFAYITTEFHFIQVKEIVDDGGWKEILPTENYKHIDGVGLVHPGLCILIPKSQRKNFLKFMDAK